MDNAGLLPKTPALEMSALSVGSRGDPETPILEDVNWSVAAGEYWVLGGLHGTGKTDFLAMTAWRHRCGGATGCSAGKCR